jgi:hypothetical protein
MESGSGPIFQSDADKFKAKAEMPIVSLAPYFVAGKSIYQPRREAKINNEECGTK